MKWVRNASNATCNNCKMSLFSFFLRSLNWFSITFLLHTTAAAVHQSVKTYFHCILYLRDITPFFHCSQFHIFPLPLSLSLVLLYCLFTTAAAISHNLPFWLLRHNSFAQQLSIAPFINVLEYFVTLGYNFYLTKNKWYLQAL